MKKVALFLIVATEFCERFCYYGLRALIFPFMRDKLFMSYTIAKFTAHAFFFLSFFFAVIFGFLSDILIGHYTTIISLSFAYFIGTIMLVISAYLENTFLFISAIFIIAIGTGGIKPCISIFGGDQFRNENFFSIFYFSINCGAMISMLILPLISEKSYIIAFSIPFLLVSLAIVLFISGTRFYTIKKPDPTLKKEILKLFYFKGNKTTRQSNQDQIQNLETPANSPIRLREGHYFNGQSPPNHYNSDYRTERIDDFDFGENEILEIDQEEFQLKQYFNEYVGDQQFSPFDLIKSERQEKHNNSFEQDCQPDPEDIKKSKYNSTSGEFKISNLLSIHEQNDDLTIHFNNNNMISLPNNTESIHEKKYPIEFVEKEDSAASKNETQKNNRPGSTLYNNKLQNDQNHNQSIDHGECSIPHTLIEDSETKSNQTYVTHTFNNDVDRMDIFYDQNTRNLPENRPSEFEQKKRIFENSNKGTKSQSYRHHYKITAHELSKIETDQGQTVSGIETTHITGNTVTKLKPLFSQPPNETEPNSKNFLSDGSVLKKSSNQIINTNFQSEKNIQPDRNTYLGETLGSKDVSITMEDQKINQKQNSPSTFKEDLLAISNIIKLFLPITFFWAIYDQQATSWTDQARKLDQNIFNFRIIPSQMLVLNAFLTLIFIPVFSHIKLSAQRKMVYGFYLGASSFFVSALVEHFKRKRTSILIQTPQYILLTSGEVLLSVTGLEFSYKMAPYRFRSLVLAIWLFMASIGNVLVAIISKLELFEAPIGEYVFYGILAFLSARILDYQFTRMKYNK